MLISSGLGETPGRRRRWACVSFWVASESQCDRGFVMLVWFTRRFPTSYLARSLAVICLCDIKSPTSTISAIPVPACL